MYMAYCNDKFTFQQYFLCNANVCICSTTRVWIEKVSEFLVLNSNSSLCEIMEVKFLTKLERDLE